MERYPLSRKFIFEKESLLFFRSSNPPIAFTDHEVVKYWEYFFRIEVSRIYYNLRVTYNLTVTHNLNSHYHVRDYNKVRCRPQTQ